MLLCLHLTFAPETEPRGRTGVEWQDVNSKIVGSKLVVVSAFSICTQFLFMIDSINHKLLMVSKVCILFILNRQEFFHFICPPLDSNQGHFQP